MPLVRVCAAGMGSVRSWLTWRFALMTDFTLDIVKMDRFPVGLKRMAGSHCGTLATVGACALFMRPVLYHLVDKKRSCGLRPLRAGRRVHPAGSASGQ